MKNFFIGIIMGIANVIPGVSGGTIAVSFNIYDKLIGLISQFRTKIKEDWKFVVFLAAGLGVGILGFAKLMVFLLEHYPVDTGFFFLGVIMGSVPMIYGKAVTPKFNPFTVIPFAICFGVMVFMHFVSPEGGASTQLNGGTLYNIIMMMVYGAIGAACMLIPGISGSFVLMFIGAYGKVMGIIAEFNFLLLCALGIGCIIGVFGCAKIINRFIYKYGNYTYSGILGFVLGSLMLVYPGYSFSADGIIPFILLIIGFSITFYFNIMDKKNEKKEKDKEEQEKASELL